MYEFKLIQDVQGQLEELGTYSLPGYAFPALLAVGLFFLFVGARICRGVVAALCCLAGGGAGYYFSESAALPPATCIVIAVASGVVAAVLGLIVQYVVVVILAGLAAGGTATLVAFLINQVHMAWVFAIGGFLLGAILAVRFYRILSIFATAALGAACVAACALVLLEKTLRPEMTDYVQLGGIYLDLYKFSVVFFGLLVAGAVVQGVASVHRKPAKEAVD